MPAIADLIPTQNLAHAEAKAINALAEYLCTDEGIAAGDMEIQLWMSERGWQPRLWRKWAERIAAAISLQDPTNADPRYIQAKLDTRFERLAHKAEENNDIKHAIEATKAQATLAKVGGFAPVAQQAVQVLITNANAHLVSDDELLKVANAKTVVGDVVEDSLLA